MNASPFRSPVPDRFCFWGILIWLPTGSSWGDIEAILEHRASDTTLRTRRDEWIAAGVIGQLRLNTDRRAYNRDAALCLATAIPIVARLLDYRDRWSPA